MYKVRKERGAYAHITVENTDTMANIIVGKMSTPIKEILEEAGHEIADIRDELDITVDTDTANKLAHMTMSMKKPVRDQRKVKEEKPKERKEPVDVFNLIFGIE